jgi:cell wall-associated protease
VTVGSVIAFTASATGCISPVYEFYVRYPSGTWYLKRGWGGGSFSWSTGGLATGVYTVHAWASHAPTTWEAIGSATVTLTGCTASLSPSSATQAAGSAVAFTASSTCPTPEYEYWVQYPGGAWYLARGWGGAAFSWSTGGLAPGAYTVHAWVNTSGTGYAAIGSASVTLTGCTAASLVPSSGSAARGSLITFTASSSGGCPNPVYEFWLHDPAGVWHQMQAFSTTATWQWNSAVWAKGTYTIHVWANQQGASTSTYETIGSATYTLT